MEPLKEMFNDAWYRHFAACIKSVYPEFKKDAFFREVTAGLSSRELNQRMRHTSETLKRFLPDRFTQALKILKAAAPGIKTGYTALVLPDYVGLYGRKHITESLEALKFFTVFGSSEFAIREFLRIDLHTTLSHMERWSLEENHHVRRLASEGSRPRLPWSFRLNAVIKNPELTRNILQNLRADEHIYVKKSVANHLNDISKDKPQYMLDLVRSWNLTNANTRWIVKHACRSLIKQGHPGSLELFSFRHDAVAEVRDLTVSPNRLKLGEALSIDFVVKNKENTAHDFVIDYAIHYRKGNGGSSRKVFKIKEIQLPPSGSVRITKNQLFRNFTTRTHYAGVHRLEILVNGKSLASAEFRLLIPVS